MKRMMLFFALLALPILAKAQDTAVFIGDTSYYYTGATFQLCDDGPVEQYRIEWYEFASAIKLMLIYADECYADSTFVEYWENTGSEPIVDSTGGSYSLAIHYYPKKVSKWIHRKPTFEGFVAWIREQGGEE